MADVPSSADESAEGAKLREIRAAADKVSQDTAALAQAANALLRQRTREKPAETILIALAVGICLGRCL